MEVLAAQGVRLPVNMRERSRKSLLEGVGDKKMSEWQALIDAVMPTEQQESESRQLR